MSKRAFLPWPCFFTAFILSIATGAGAQGNLDSGKSCTSSTTFAKRIEFASLPEAMNILGKPDPWARQLSDFELHARQKTTEPTTLHEFLDFAPENAVQWSAQERAAWQAVIDQLSIALSDLNVRIPGDLRLVRTTGREEFNAAYHRSHAIMLAPLEASFAVEAPDVAYFLLAHELFHVLSSEDSTLRDDLYALLGFSRFHGFEYPLELEARRLSNPDSFTYEHAVIVHTDSGAVPVVPVIQVRVPLEDAIELDGEAFFTVVGIDLLAVNTTSGQVIRDATNEIVKFDAFDDRQSDWISLMARNTDFIIQAEEVLADNFALVMQWRATGVFPAVIPDGFQVNDPGLLVAIEDRVRRGCGHDR